MSQKSHHITFVGTKRWGKGRMRKDSRGGPEWTVGEAKGGGPFSLTGWKEGLKRNQHQGCDPKLRETPTHCFYWRWNVIKEKRGK